MNDQQILTLIAKHPRIRAVQLANMLDTPLVDVSASLRSLVDVGDVVRETKFENGNERQYQVYELSDEFKKSREGKQIATSLAGAPPVAEPKPEVAAASEPVNPPLPAPSPFAQLETEPAAAPTGSKVDRAIEWIRAHGAATDDQLREVMDIGDRPPRAYLTSAMNSGRVMRDGALWKLGAGKPERKAEPLTRDEVKDLPAAVVEQLSKPAQALAAPPPSAYRCGIWSDGTIELQLNGEEVARLTQAELAVINDFMAKRWAA